MYTKTTSTVDAYIPELSTFNTTYICLAVLIKNLMLIKKDLMFPAEGKTLYFKKLVPLNKTFKVTYLKYI